MIFFIVFGLIAVTLFVWLYTSLYSPAQPVSPAAWLLSISFVTLFYYWLDKRLAKAEGLHIRIPEAILNLLAMAGGFPGAWIGRILFDHKTNTREHRWMFIVLVLTTVIYCILAYAFLPAR